MMHPYELQPRCNVSRGRSSKLLATLPDSYSTDWISKLDKRTKVARAVLERIEALEEDAGGADNLGHARRSLIRRAVWIEALCEGNELRVAAGEQVDIGALTQLTNSLLGIYRSLGLERKAKRIPSLAERLAQSATSEVAQ
jgi:hypothetical protein